MRQGTQGRCTGTTLGVGWEGRWEGASGWGTHVHPRLIHVSVWQKTIQYCKVINLQLKEKKRICLQCRRLRFDLWVGKIPCGGKWQLALVFLPGESHGQRSLVGYIAHGVAKSQT